ncbi:MULTISPECIES: hypothetical protein [Serratia]|uniref:Uncharacterized protein n=1 Tax=Serratia ureilytica TaxID=300181 RepID=A0ABU0VMA7_9GAMM|nr:hypothetical protein [Serratia ureilytica]MCU7065208.1 hypothetical protein [Serratia ureilytica]MDQ1809184.1 hypothetical protein [Serratia ureilytica]MDQ1838431.1 hypothetical protein [Serratia ureilytica]MDQ1862100.1 hypothetical protein [Serratia ureilytica]QWU36351.1 hypothetical protein KQJ82_02480 [Serratia ureilytica]
MSSGVLRLHFHPERFLAAIIKLLFSRRDGMAAVVYDFVAYPAFAAQIVGLKTIRLHLAQEGDAVAEFIKYFALFNDVFLINEAFDDFRFVDCPYL